MTQHLYKKEHIVTSVVAVIVDDDERVLLTQRSIPPFADQWVMPGGKIDLGEPILRALHREVREEVGLEVTVEGLMDNNHFVILYYRCRPVTTELSLNPEEVAAAEWVDRPRLLAFPMPEGTRFILGKLFPELCNCDISNLKP
jgi:8-oxo-dGTP diphosphatase